MKICITAISDPISGYNLPDLVREAQIRWLKPAEVLFILQTYKEDQLAHEPPKKPSSNLLICFILLPYCIKVQLCVRIAVCYG